MIREKNMMTIDFAITLLSIILRRLLNDEPPYLNTFRVGIQKEIVNVLFAIPSLSEFDEEFGKYFILMEDILLSLN